MIRQIPGTRVIPMFLVQAQDMVTRLANILRYSLQRERNHKVPLETELEVVSDSLVSSNGANRSRRLALKRTKCRVDVSYSTFITGTCDCFAGARLLLSRCCVELGRSAPQTWTIRVKGARITKLAVQSSTWLYHYLMRVSRRLRSLRKYLVWRHQGAIPEASQVTSL